MLADKAYDTDRIRELIQELRATRWKPCLSKTLDRERNLIERSHFRRVATRYDKLE